MLQRIQSVYLFLAAVAVAVFAFMPAVVSAADGHAILTAVKPDAEGMYLVLLCMCGLIALLALITIFKYKTLKAQKRLCKINILFVLAMLVSIGIITYAQPEALKAVPSWFNLLPVAAIVLLALAHRGIAHDLKLLSDSSRLR